REPSQITAAETGNRLTATSRPGDPAAGPFTATYAHDAHGNMTRMPHLSVMAWDEDDWLRSTTPNAGGTPQVTWYAYDASGQRVRKSTDQPGTTVLKSERIYLGAIEVYREYGTGGTPSLERETLHVADGERSIALAENRTKGTDKGSAALFRYQHSNHLGSAVLELDDKANIITYEEYFPYGSTSYQAVTSQTETPKRYRYTGKERDEESDLYYHGARYYAPWLGRWTSTDPQSRGTGISRYEYAAGNPARFNDPDGAAAFDATKPSWLQGVTSQHVEGNIWEVKFRVGGWHPVGPHEDLTKFRTKMGLTADSHHIVGGEHLEDIGSSFSYEKAPAVLIDPGLHKKIITPRITRAQKEFGGRYGGRAPVTPAEVQSLYRDVYEEEFPELRTISRNIIRQSASPGPGSPGSMMGSVTEEFGGASSGPGILKAIGTAGIVAGAVADLYAPVAAAQQIDESAAQLGQYAGTPTGIQRAKLEHPGFVLIINQIQGQTFMFDPQKHGPAALYRILGNQLEAADLHVETGSLVKVGDLHWQSGEQRWATDDLYGEAGTGWLESIFPKQTTRAWVDANYPGGSYGLNMTKW
ncbi:MAG: RHS repeat-associated core domain-containing protein, partial [Streptosporangiaceae bacterium]